MKSTVAAPVSMARQVCVQALCFHSIIWVLVASEDAMRRCRMTRTFLGKSLLYFC